MFYERRGKMKLSSSPTKQVVVQQHLDNTYNELLNHNDVKGEKYSEWVYDNTDLRFNIALPTFPIYSGSVYFVDFGLNIGSEQEHYRPAIVVWNQRNSPFVVVIPLSTQHGGSTLWTHVHMEHGDTALIEQIRNVSKARLDKPQSLGGNVRRLSDSEKTLINRALNQLKLRI